MKRFPHRLKPNEIETWPAQVIFFDTETRYKRKNEHITEHKLRMGVACHVRYRRDGKSNKEEWITFYDASEFWEFVVKRNYSRCKLYIVAHNLAFDFQVVGGFTQLKQRGYLLQFVYESGHTRIVKYGYPTNKYLKWIEEGHKPNEFKGKRWKKTIVLLDNCNLFAGSIEKWGDTLGLPKLKIPKDGDSNELWEVYCRRDVEIMVKLWEGWKDFLSEHNLGKFQYTIGSQAFSGFRHGYMHNAIYIHAHEKAMKLERDSYFGGRTEAFRVGEYSGKFYKLDVNSMYPAVMFHNDYPTCLIGYYEKGLTIPQLNRALKKYCVIAEVETVVEKPVFPVRDNGKNIYPIGNLRLILSSPELEYIINEGWDLRVLRYAVYRKRPIFKWYVNALYELKKEYSRKGDKLRRQLVKLLLNSLYGKFGQRGYEDNVIGFCEPNEFEVQYGKDLKTGERFRIIKAGGVIIKSSRTGEGFNSFCGIASHVTAYARIYLWKLIEQAGVDNVYYTDTDSLICNEQGYRNVIHLLDDEELGYLKVEGIAETLTINAPKDYVFGSKVTKKGIPSNAIQCGENTFEVEIWPSMLGHLREGNVTTFCNKHVVKHLSYNVDWGILEPDGRVRPYHFGQSPLNF